MLPMAQVEMAAEAVSRAIGHRVRQGRGERGWTLDQLAQRSGVSRRMVVNVEQGGSNPSIATLLRLADALGIALPALVDAAGDHDAVAAVTRAGTVPPMWTSHELWDWTLGPGDDYRSEAHHVGTRELLLVLSGSVDVVVGDSVNRLAPGDSVAFDGSHAHAYRNASKKRGARFALTVYDPAVAKDA